MKQYHVWGRLWIGFGLGTIIGNIVTLIVSYTFGRGSISFMSQLMEYFSREADAFLVQFLLCGLIGVIFAEAGIILVLEKWNFPIRCLLHFAATAVFYVPFLWFCSFGQEPWLLILIVLANVLFTYVVTWLTSYLMIRSGVDSINRRIEEMRGESGNGSHSN